MNDAFALLADPGRRQILALLRNGERSVGELCDALPLSQPGVSKHLRLMRDAGLLSVRADAQRRFYRIEPGPLQALDRWLEPYRQFWSERLEALEHHLDREC
jgi:DNA-binding transcriptional ArsR family regulator